MAKTCSISDCDLPVCGRGWCSKHYQRWQRHGDPEHETVYTTTRTPRLDPCSVTGCDDFATARGYCKMHWQRVKRTGDPGPALRLIDPRESGAASRKCLSCGETKPADSFLADPRSKDKLRSQCRSCRTLEDRRTARLRRYGLSSEDYERILATQGGGCAVCGGSIRLCVDHEHATGKVRGILCNNCNVALGRLGDDVARIRRLADYLS